MNDPIHIAIEDAVDRSITYEFSIDYLIFENVLSEHGFMIVPIEDPTNLFGDVDER